MGSFRMTQRQKWLIVGLGNPGSKYEHTRHNLGARVVEALRVSLEQPPFRAARTLSARVSEGSVILALPTTFMNDSGTAILALVKKFRIPLDRLLVVHDDKDLVFGKLKLQRDRSSAGHKGVQSIIEHLNTTEFFRLRMGIGTPTDLLPTETFVLQRFTPEEEHVLTQNVLQQATKALKKHLQLK